MHKQEQHEMLLETTHPSGAEGWYCPICGRRMLINWGPQFQRMILEAGDNHAIHSASKGSTQTKSSQVEAADASPSVQGDRASSDDPNLAAWLTWLDESDFDDLWDDEGQ